MQTLAGLWIDHREAVIVLVSAKGPVTKRIKSNVERQLRRSGCSPSRSPFEPQMVPADDAREREYGHRAEPLFQTVKPVTLFSSFKSLTFRLWDEQHRKLVGFRVVKNRPPGAGRFVGRFMAELFLSPGGVSGSRTGPRSSA